MSLFRMDNDRRDDHEEDGKPRRRRQHFVSGHIALPAYSLLPDNNIVSTRDQEQASMFVKMIRVRQLLERHRFKITIGFVCLWFGLYLVALMDKQTQTIGLTSPTPLIEYDSALDLSTFEHCDVSIDPIEQNQNPELRSFWFTQYPDAVPESAIRFIVQALTGTPTGGVKSFYAQNKVFRKCKGGGFTVGCMQIYPMIGTDPEIYRETFNPEVVYSIRNPATHFPFHQNSKAIRYAKHEGQVSEDGWRLFRDTYLVEMMEGWKKQLRTWKKLSSYHIALYLHYEKLMDPASGPGLVLRLLKMIRSEGFETLSEEDVPCIWYKSIGKDALESYHRYRYDFHDYTPGYTKDQLTYMSEEMAGFIREMKGDKELTEILQGYHQAILQETRLDRPWVNETAGN